jgi:nitrite reductase/ring-hydroxylating ferredoxin subunit
VIASFDHGSTIRTRRARQTPRFRDNEARDRRATLPQRHPSGAGGPLASGLSTNASAHSDPLLRGSPRNPDKSAETSPNHPERATTTGRSQAPEIQANRCRHLFASLGKGRVTDDGCLQCPWHAALYDVGTGAMLRGPQGAFRPLAGAVKATTGAWSLKTFPVEVRDGAIWLVA